MTYLSLGIVGCGTVARLHAAALVSVHGVRVGAVLGTDIVKASPLAAQVDAIATDDMDVFAGHVDAVVVASPSHLHPAHACALLSRGLPTLVELPPARPLAEAGAIRDAAGQAPAVVFGAHTSRWLPAVRAIAAAVAEGRIGDITSVAIDRNVAPRQRR